jgi:hypothetical protein
MNSEGVHARAGTLSEGCWQHTHTAHLSRGSIGNPPALKHQQILKHIERVVLYFQLLNHRTLPPCPAPALAAEPPPCHAPVGVSKNE